MKNHDVRAYLSIILCVILAAFAATWYYTVHFRSWFEPPSYASWHVKTQVIDKCQAGDVVVLGSSQASVGVIPRLLHVKAWNLALISGTPIEGYFAAKRLYDCPVPPTTFIITYNGKDLSLLPFFWERAVAFGFMRFDDLQDVARQSASLGDRSLYNGSFGSEPPPVMKNWLYANHFPPYDFASLIAAHGAKRRRSNARLEAENVAARGQAVLHETGCATAPAWEAQQDSFRPLPLTSAYFNRLLDLLQAHHARVLILRPVVSTLTAQAMKVGYRREFEAFMSNAQAAHPGLQTIGPPWFSPRAPCLFSDDEHLNTVGTEAYTREIDPMVQVAMAASH